MQDSETETMPQQTAPYSPPQPPAPTVLGPQSWVPIGFVGAICVALLTVKSWLDSQFDAMRTQVQALQMDIREVRGAVADRWTASDMALWTEKLARTNPGMQIPAPEPTHRNEIPR